MHTLVAKIEIQSDTAKGSKSSHKSSVSVTSVTSCSPLWKVGEEKRKCCTFPEVMVRPEAAMSPAPAARLGRRSALSMQMKSKGGEFRSSWMARSRSISKPEKLVWSEVQRDIGGQLEVRTRIELAKQQSSRAGSCIIVAILIEPSNCFYILHSCFPHSSLYRIPRLNQQSEIREIGRIQLTSSFNGLYRFVQLTLCFISL